MHWSGLPERLRTDPHLTSFRLDHLEHRVTALEEGKDEPQMVQTPLGKLPIQVALIGFLALLIARPDLASRLIP